MFVSKFRLIAVLVFALGTVMLTAPTVEAQTVHALQVIMENDTLSAKPATFNAGMRVNQEGITGFLRKVDGVYHVEETVYLSSRGETTVDNVLRWVRNVPSTSQDVVFVYYSGHGAMVSKTDRRTWLALDSTSAGQRTERLYRDDLADAVKSRPGRLKLIVTDACSSYDPSVPSKLVSFASPVPRKNKKMITDLFGEHEGVLHVNGASEGQYGWTNATGGSYFTESFLEAIKPDADMNGDGFVEWGEVFAIAQNATEEKFKQKKNAGSLSLNPPDDPQGQEQVPKAYELPGRLHQRPPAVENLWDIGNPRPGLAVSMTQVKSRYRARDSIQLTLRVERDCYITLLNWDTQGNFRKLFPNRFQEDNFIRGGETLRFPDDDADFELELGGAGREKFKLIAVTSRADNDAITQAFARESGQALAQKSTRQPDGAIALTRVKGKVQKERSLLDIISDLRLRDWAETRFMLDVDP